MKDRIKFLRQLLSSLEKKVNALEDEKEDEKISELKKESYDIITEIDDLLK